jgi:PAS domain S-box-containing protein
MKDTKKNIMENTEKYFKLMIENSQDLLTVLQLDGKITYMVPSIERIMGYSQEEITGTSIFDYVNPGDAKELKDAVFRAITKPGSAEMSEVRFKRKDGSWVILESKGIASMSLSGMVIIANSRDVTKEREAEEKISAIFDQTSQLFGLVSTEGILLKVNKTALEFCGAKESDVLNKPFWETIWWTHSSDLQKKLKEAIEKAVKGEIFNFEVNHFDANKKLHYFDFHLKPFRDKTGKVILLFTESFDVTVRKSLEEQIIKEKHEQESILDSIPALIFYKDNKNNFIHVNKTASDVMGLPREQMEGKSLFDISPKEHADAYFKDDQEVIASGIAKRGILEPMATIKNGVRLLKVDKIPYKDENGDIIGVIGFGIDVTESKAAEEKKNGYLTELEKFKALMVGRELKMVELKQRVKDLEGNLQKPVSQDSTDQKTEVTQKAEEGNKT